MNGMCYVKVMEKEARKTFIEFLEKNGFELAVDSVFPREDILDSKLLFL